jgi:hypothetical protein
MAWSKNAEMRDLHRGILNASAFCSDALREHNFLLKLSVHFAEGRRGIQKQSR